MNKSSPFESFLTRIESPRLRVVAQLWREARGVEKMPSWEALSSSPALAPHFKLLWGFKYDLETEEFRGWLIGDRLKKWADVSIDGVRLEDIQARRQWHPHLRKIVTTPLAGRSSGRLFIVRDFAVTGERIALPLAENGKCCDGVLGASDYVAPPLLGPVELVHENVEWYAI